MLTGARAGQPRRGGPLLRVACCAHRTRHEPLPVASAQSWDTSVLVPYPVPRSLPSRPRAKKAVAAGQARTSNPHFSKGM